VASAGPYANHLHLAPGTYRVTMLVPHHSDFCKPAFPAAHPTASKHRRHIGWYEKWLAKTESVVAGVIRLHRSTMDADAAWFV